MHTSKDVYKFDQEELVVKNIIKQSLLKKKYAGRTMLEIRVLKKLVKKNEIVRTKQINVRFSDKEKKSIVAKANKRDQAVSDYIRMKLFS